MSSSDIEFQWTVLQERLEAFEAAKKRPPRINGRTNFKKLYAAAFSVVEAVKALEAVGGIPVPERKRDGVASASRRRS